MERQPELCFAAFEASESTLARLPDRPSDVGCPLKDVVRLEGSSLTLRPARPVATCPLAAAWMLFERHALQPAAKKHFGAPVVEVRHLGSYVCRNVYWRSSGRRSEHATANALDIVSFRISGGREIQLQRDWGKGVEGAFLNDVQQGACRFFRAVLGPEYNAAHHDHFHMDRGRWSRCS
ncbi:extensin family protein [Pseudoroseomonas globiformis]|uniref:Extensin family protein n=1 Tax=Teichococcus globiformis TaxID=2307229 RepID=A0ABV7FZI7_9PROT